MRIGISVAQCDRLGRPAAVAAAVKAAEQLGYSSVWVCDSAPDPAGVLSAAAAVTNRVRLGAAILVGDREDPVSLARALATVDLLSEGRLTVAIGVRPEAREQALDPVLDALAGTRAPVLLDGRTPGVFERAARGRGLEPGRCPDRGPDYKRWERSRAMELWQTDIVGGVILSGGREAKIVTASTTTRGSVSRPKVVARATATPTCDALAMRRHGVPDQVLTDIHTQLVPGSLLRLGRLRSFAWVRRLPAVATNRVEPSGLLAC